MDPEVLVTEVKKLYVGPEEILAVIAPDLSGDNFMRFAEVCTRELGKLDLRVVVFPYGTDLAIVSEKSTSVPSPIPPLSEARHLANRIG